MSSPPNLPSEAIEPPQSGSPSAAGVPVIRKGRKEDIPRIIGGLGMFVMSLGYKHCYLPGITQLDTILQKMILDGLLFVYEEDGTVYGMIGGEKLPHPYNSDVLMLYEHFWWIDPEKRRSGAGTRLLRALLEEGSDCQCIKISLEHNSEVPDGYLERFGLRLAEYTYIKEQ